MYTDVSRIYFLTVGMRDLTISAYQRPVKILFDQSSEASK